MPVSLLSGKKNRYFTKTPIDIFVIAHSVLLRIRNVLGKSCRENQNTYFMFDNILPKIVPLMRYCGNTM
jgi:hypothetical protein